MLRKLMHSLRRAIWRHGSQPAAIGWLAGLSAGDFVLPLLPTQSAVLALGVLQPTRHRQIALAFALASGMGACLLVAIGHWLLQPVLPDWPWVRQALADYGWLALGALAALPLAPRSLILLSAAAGVSAWQIVLAVLLGRMLLFTALLALLRRVCLLQRRWPRLGDWFARHTRAPDA